MEPANVDLVEIRGRPAIAGICLNDHLVLLTELCEIGGVRTAIKDLHGIEYLRDRESGSLHLGYIGYPFHIAGKLGLNEVLAYIDLGALVESAEETLRDLEEIAGRMAAFVLQLYGEAAAGAETSNGRLRHVDDVGEALDAGGFLGQLGNDILIAYTGTLIPGLETNGHHAVGATAAADIVVAQGTHGVSHCRDGADDAVYLVGHDLDAFHAGGRGKTWILTNTVPMLFFWDEAGGRGVHQQIEEGLRMPR